MGLFQIHKPMQISVMARRFPGLELILMVRRPTWDEADAMRRLASEHNISMMELGKAAKKDGTGKDKAEDTNFADPELLRSITKLRADFDETVAKECLENFVVGFVDKAGDEYVLSDEQGDLPCEKIHEARWKQVLWDVLHRGLADVWRQLLELSTPGESDVTIATSLQKN